VNRWQKVAVAIGAVAGAAVVGPRLLWFRRRPLPEGFVCETLDGNAASGDVNLAVARYQAGRDRLVIVVHGLLKSMNSPSIVATLAALRDHVDVVALDLAGHGQSSGECVLSPLAGAAQIESLVNEARASGYRQVALLGCSFGAAAAIRAAAQGVPVDAVVAVSSPAAPLHTLMTRGQRSSGLWRPWAWLMGTRLGRELDPGPWPINYVADVAPVPLLIVHEGWDTLVPREHSETLYAVARPPKRFLDVPHGLHADPLPSLDAIIAWLDEVMGVPRARRCSEPEDAGATNDASVEKESHG
jgi:pimeloyl-ACP methyl ester carboxylesterase